MVKLTDTDIESLAKGYYTSIKQLETPKEIIKELANHVLLYKHINEQVQECEDYLNEIKDHILYGEQTEAFLKLKKVNNVLQSFIK